MSKNNQEDITSWLDNAGRFRILEPEVITLLSRQIQSLPASDPKRRRLVNKIVNHNLRLVPRYVKAFMDCHSHNKWGSAETVDYLQVGVVGLMRAAEKYDPARGYTFSTYANHWIRSTVGRYNLKTLTPVHLSESAARQLVFYKSNGYLPLKNAQGVMPKDRAKKVIRSLFAAYGCVSIDAESEEGGSLKEFLADSCSHEEADYSMGRLEEAMREAGITKIGRQILVGYFVDRKKNKDLADSLGISIDILKKEKRLALEQARRNPGAFSSRYDGLVLSP